MSAVQTFFRGYADTRTTRAVIKANRFGQEGGNIMSDYIQDDGASSWSLQE